ncbi:MAG: hypothetical protein ACFE96_18190 [Candidatus Hermodarchaeota archaeon]
MIFDGIHQGMGMMMNLDEYFWIFLFVGFIAFVLIIILILNLMKRSTNQENISTIFDNYSSEVKINKKTLRNVPKYCPGCGEKISEFNGMYCPICGIKME